MSDDIIPPQLTLVYSAGRKPITEDQGEELLAMLDLLRSIPWLPNPHEIPVDGVPEMVVDARELAEALGSMRQFANWISHWKDEGFAFIEKTINNASVKNPGRPTAEYWLPVNAFKDLIIRSKSPRSEEVRAHFVESHKKFSAGKSSQVVTAAERSQALPSQALPTHLQTAKMLVSALEQLEAQAPKVAFAEMVGDSKDLYALRHAANKFGIPQNQFLILLDDWDILYHSNRWHGTARAIQSEFVRDVIVDTGHSQTKITSKGLEYIGTRLNKEGLMPWPKRKK